MTPRPTIDLRIDELVLEGFAPDARLRIGAAVERELARLLAEAPLSRAVASHDGAARLDGGALHAAPGASPEQVGAAVARAVHGGLTATKGGPR